MAAPVLANVKIAKNAQPVAVIKYINFEMKGALEGTLSLTQHILKNTAQFFGGTRLQVLILSLRISQTQVMLAIDPDSIFYYFYLLTHRGQQIKIKMSFCN